MSAPGLQLHTNPVESLLARLPTVEKHGKGWRARCPAHGSDKNRSLSIAVADDGRVLLHCFAGCGALEIVHAVGLELSDLFEKRITHNTTPAERRQLREYAKAAHWAAALDVLEFEARVVLVAADLVEKGLPLGQKNRERLAVSMRRIEGARAVFRGR